MPDPTPSASPRRIVGVTVPLFSLRTQSSWGIGDIADLAPTAEWLAREAHVRLIQILPLGEIGASETSPYSALSAFGIDPMYVNVAAVPEVGPELARDSVGSDMAWQFVRDARDAARVNYDAVRFVKGRALRFAFDRFLARERAARTERAADFDRFVRHHAAWLPEYALFRALKDRFAGKPWWEWPAELRTRNEEALARARHQLRAEVAYYEYVQWVAHAQWDAARAKLRALGVELMGDLPFMVGRDSADVWAGAREFRHDRNVGVPPDQFNEDGQDWGLPPYNWATMRAEDFSWLRRRARYAASLYDRFRIDHLVGFYRTYSRPIPSTNQVTGKLLPGTFDPSEQRAQLAHGERVVGAMKDAARERGGDLIAEDLGTVPDWVRTSLTKLNVPGYKVLVWEKDADVFRDPKAYPARSVTCFGTHDSDPVAAWWEGLDAKERAAARAIPSLRSKAGVLGASCTPAVHSALLEALLNAPSELALLMVQDLLTLRARINVPATVGPHNWTWRLAEPVETLRERADVRASLARVAAAAEATGRAVAANTAG